jgi:hypothetical protein
VADEKQKTPHEMFDISLEPSGDLLTPKPDFQKGTYCYSAPVKHATYLGLPYPREWRPNEPDWKLPYNWQ